VVAFVSIPLALLSAVIVVNALGWTINTMTLGGLAVALGVVVDDAIIGVENIVRRLRGTRGQGAEAAEGHEFGDARAAGGARGFGEGQRTSDLREVIQVASLEVRAPVVYATFVVVLVLAPMLMLSGLQGSFFAPTCGVVHHRDVGIARCRADRHAGGSLSATHAFRPATPSRDGCSGSRGSTNGFTALDRVSSTGAHRFAGRNAACGGGAAVLRRSTDAALSRGPLRGAGGRNDRAPRSKPMKALGTRGLAGPARDTGILSVEQTIGPRGVRRGHVGAESQPNFISSCIECRGVPKRERMMPSARASSVIRSLQAEVMTFLGDRLSESCQDETAQVAINIFGPDLDELDRVADQVAAAVRTVARGRGSAGQSTLRRTFSAGGSAPARLQQYGFHDRGRIGHGAEAYEGATAAQVYDANKVIDLVVRLPAAERIDPEAIGALLVRAPSGVTVPLRELTTITLTE